MKLTGLHLLLTYQCNFECDHCFVWGSPRQNGVMTLAEIRLILQQACDLGTITSIYFEGGEPFLYYAVLLQAVREAAGLGFEVGIVSNGFWANSEKDSLTNLRPFAGLVKDLSVSSDLYHGDQPVDPRSGFVSEAARKLGIPTGVISVAQPEGEEPGCTTGQIPEGESRVMYRGRAAETLACRAPGQPWENFTTCPHEDLREPGRVHIDPLGNVHLCQEILLGNIFQTPLAEICESFDPQAHPIVAPLLRGGPAELARTFNYVTGPGHADGVQSYADGVQSYADACHLCYSVRKAVRSNAPELLGPNQMYGEGLG